MNILMQNIVKLIVVLLLQVLVFSNMDYLGYIAPYIYLIFLLDMPISFNRNWAMVTAFLLGLVIDAFDNTLGIHAFASVFIVFFRLYWLELLTPHGSLRDKNQNQNLSPSPKSLGLAVYMRYAVGMVFVHHLLLFYLEAFTLSGFGYTLLRVLCNTVVTLMLIMSYEMLRKS